MVRAWTVRGGQQGEREEQALEDKMVFIGWDEAGDLSGYRSRDEVGAVLGRAFPEEQPGTLDNWKYQLWRFKSMEVGDLVVMPRKFQGSVAIGRLTGDYEYRAEAPPGFRHTRKVDWVRHVERGLIGGDLRDSIGAFLTVSELTRRDAAYRVETLLQTGADPGYKGAVDPPADADALEQEVREKGTRQLSARDLIGLWKAQRRTDDVIEMVDQQLADRGLQVVPHFTEVQLDDLITVSAADITVVGEAAPETELGHTVTRLTGQDLSRHWRIGSLPFTREVATIGIDKPLNRAITRMVEGRYSQLPVVDENRVLRGVLTWESIAQSHWRKEPASITTALVPHPATAKKHEELFDRIGAIQRHGFLIITDDGNLVLGILTAADLADQLKQRAEPFILLGEAERRLRRLVNRLPLDILPPNARNKRAKGKNLTLGQYPEVLRNEKCWERLGWPYEQEDVAELVGTVKDYRNDLAHWDMDAPEKRTEPLAATKRLLLLLKGIDPDPRP